MRILNSSEKHKYDHDAPASRTCPAADAVAGADPAALRLADAYRLAAELVFQAWPAVSPGFLVYPALPDALWPEERFPVSERVQSYS